MKLKTLLTKAASALGLKAKPKEEKLPFLQPGKINPLLRRFLMQHRRGKVRGYRKRSPLTDRNGKFVSRRDVRMQLIHESMRQGNEVARALRNARKSGETLAFKLLYYPRCAHKA